MITLIRDGRRVDHIGHPITRTEAATVTKVLAAEGIRIEPTEPDAFGVVHLWAREPIDTAAAVRTLRAFHAVSDGPFACHQAVSRG